MSAHKFDESVTAETTAGACSLDGEELTLALLHENESLMARNINLRRENTKGFWALYLTLIAFIITLLVMALRW